MPKVCNRALMIKFVVAIFACDRERNEQHVVNIQSSDGFKWLFNVVFSCSEFAWHFILVFPSFPFLSLYCVSVRSSNDMKHMAL